MSHRPAPPLTPSLNPDVPRDRLLATNLAAIAACDHELARRVAAARTSLTDAQGAELPIAVRASACGWPTVSAGPLHIHSAYDPIAEAEVQALRVPAQAEQVLALGFGAGPLLSLLLSRPALRRLDVVTLNAGVLHAVAGAVDLRPLLCDPRLRLRTPEPLQLTTPFAPLPALLRNADEELLGLRDAACEALALEDLARRRALLAPRFRSALDAHQRAARPDPDVSALLKQRRGALALVVAAGPSLLSQLPRLRGALGSLRRHAPEAVVLIAEEEALPTLAHEGLLPEFVVALGVAAAPPLCLSRPLPESLALVYAPLLPLELVSAFRGPRYQLRRPEALGLSPAAPSSDDPLCSEVSSLPAALALARHLGAGSALLLGVDLGTSPDAAPELAFARRARGVRGDLLVSSAEQLAVRRSLAALLARSPDFKVFQTSPVGVAIQGAEALPLDEALALTGLCTEGQP